jgi:Protein of unknown function (DUF2924)
MKRIAKPVRCAIYTRVSTDQGLDGFAWNGKTYPSLSKVAFAITGTRWSGPKFFGLRDKPPKGSSL